MSSRVNRRPGGNLATLARWFGFDRNPLRRGTDRVEGVLRLVMIIVVAEPWLYGAGPVIWRGPGSRSARSCK